jgi:tetratricopeptide (TPR) repeat protein
VLQIATHHASPYSKVFSLWCSGVAQVTGKNFGAALQSYMLALQLITQTKVAVEFEAEIQAGLAESYLKTGDHDRAMQVAEEATALSRRRNNRPSECKALIVYGAALKASGNADNATRAEALFDQAEQVITKTSAKIFERELKLVRSS